MKATRLRINRKTKITGIRKFRKEVEEIVHDCLMDIKWYIVDDLTKMFKKKGIIYAKKSQKNKKTKKR